MNKFPKIAATTVATFVAAYVSLTWFYFGSPHPCSIVTRLVEWETGQYSDEQWLELARAYAIIGLNYTDFPKSQKDKLVEELRTAPAEVVQKYLRPDFSPEVITRELIEMSRTDTPASCVEILFGRLKRRLVG